jgi:hypothetical protein
MKGAEIYQIWNGTFSPSFDTVTIAPNQPWNTSIPSGGTNGTVGFCATERMIESSGSTVTLPFALASVLTATGTY